MSYNIGSEIGFSLVIKGPVIFNAGYRGGVKRGGVPKYFETFSWGMKTFCHVLMGYENIFE